MYHTPQPILTRVCVNGPASLSNLGPGFDTLGLCITGFADQLEIELSETPGVQIASVNNPSIPTQVEKNTAGVAATLVLQKIAPEQGIRMHIKKGIPIGSGIGGSAASAVAAAWGVNALFGYPLSRHELIEPVLQGEAIASGSIHGDNVLPALLGGMILVSSQPPIHYYALPLPENGLHFALLLPRVEILTQEARHILPETVPFQQAIQHASSLAFLLEALRRNDLEIAGKYLMADKIVEPVRASRIPCYADIRKAALEAGAFGCTLSGSGPAMLALASSETHATQIALAMREACTACNLPAQAHAVTSLPHGASTISNAP